jgi:hypothetical protein
MGDMGAYKLLTTGFTKPKKIHIRIVHVSICLYVCMPWMGDWQVEAVAKGGVVLVVLLEYTVLSCDVKIHRSGLCLVYLLTIMFTQLMFLFLEAWLLV